MITELPGQPPVSESKPKDMHRVGIIITASLGVFQELDISFDLMNTQRQLRDAGVFARIKEAFLLPESYTVLLVVMKTYRIWWIGVESPDLLPVPDSEEPPEITPIYMREGDMVQLTKILVRRHGDEVNVLREAGAAREVPLRGQPLVEGEAETNE